MKPCYRTARAYKICWLAINFQSGPVAECGLDGLQIDQLIQVCILTLDKLNRPPYGDRLNSLAITNLEYAQGALERRSMQRALRGVEGTSAP